MLARYSELHDLHLVLKSHGFRGTFPPKTWLDCSSDSSFVESRRGAIETYMQELVKNQGLFSQAFLTAWLRRHSRKYSQKEPECVCCFEAPVLVTVEPGREGCRRVEDSDRWHFRSFDTWRISACPSGPLEGMVPQEVEHRFKYVDRLVRALDLKSAGMAKMQKGWLSKPSKEERKAEVREALAMAMEHSESRRSLLLKAFFTGFKVFEALYKHGRVSPEDPLHTVIGKLREQHRQFPDFGTWLMVRARAQALRIHLDKTRQEQEARVQKFRARSEAHEKHLSKLWNSWEEQPSRLLSMGWRLEALKSRRARQVERMLGEKQLLSIQIKVKAPLFFPGTKLSGSFEAAKACRDTGREDDERTAALQHQDFLDTERAMISLASDLEQLPSTLKQLHEEAVRDQAAVQSALGRKTWEDYSLGSEDADIKELLALRGRIDAIAREEQKQLAASLPELIRQKEGSKKTLRALQPALQQLAKEKAAWEREHGCLDQERAATLAELRRLEEKVDTLYAPLLVDRNSAEAWGSALERALRECDNRHAALKQLLSDSSSHKRFAQRQRGSSERRSGFLLKQVASADAAFNRQRGNSSIGPPAKTLDDKYTHMWNSAEADFKKTSKDMQAAQAAFNNHVEQGQRCKDMVGECTRQRLAAENPFAFPKQRRFHPPSLQLPDHLPDGFKTAEADHFWRLLLANAEAAGQRQCELSNMHKKQVLPALRANWRCGEEVHASLERSRTAFNAWDAQMSHEEGLKKKLVQVLTQHRALRESRVQDFRATISSLIKAWAQKQEQLRQLQSSTRSIYSRHDQRRQANQKSIKLVQDAKTFLVQKTRSQPNLHALQGQPLPAKLNIWNSWARFHQQALDATKGRIQSMHTCDQSCRQRRQDVANDDQQLVRLVQKLNSLLHDCEGMRRDPVLAGYFRNHKVVFDPTLQPLRVSLTKLRQDASSTLRGLQMLLKNNDRLRRMMSRQGKQAYDMESRIGRVLHKLSDARNRSCQKHQHCREMASRVQQAIRAFQQQAAQQAQQAAHPRHHPSDYDLPDYSEGGGRP